MVDIKFEKNRVVAYSGDIIVGSCDFIEDNDIWNITHTEVDKKYQGQGIAKKLVESVIKNAKLYNKCIIADCSYAQSIIEKVN